MLLSRREDWLLSHDYLNHAVLKSLQEKASPDSKELHRAAAHREMGGEGMSSVVDDRHSTTEVSNTL